MTYVEIGCLLAAVVVASLRNWRLGVLFAVVIGFLQDPIRKLTPGEPVVLSATVLVAMVITGAFAVFRLGAPNLRRLFPLNIRQVAGLFIILVLIQSIRTAAFKGSPVLGLLGLLFYMSPLLAIWIAFHFSKTLLNVKNLLQVYCAAVLAASGTILLSVAGYRPRLFEEVGTGLWVYSRYLQNYIPPHVGILRSAEIAGWHMAAGACFLFVYAVSFTRGVRLAVCIMLSGGLAAVALFSARRKTLILFILFLCFYGLLLLIKKQRTSTRRIVFALLMCAIGGGSLFLSSDSESAGQLYFEQGGTAFGDAGGRFVGVGIDGAIASYKQGGFLGLGAGAGAQGAQHFGGVRTGWGAEGGIGKIIAELGVLGFVPAFLAGFLILRFTWRSLGSIRREMFPYSPLAFGLMAFLFANIPVFIIAAQVYGDYFVLLILGLSLGAALRIPRLVHAAAIPVAQNAGMNSQSGRLLPQQFRHRDIPAGSG